MTKKKIFFFRFFFLLGLLTSFLFFSCADSTPEISSVIGSVVFDYKDSESAPETRLAVFIQTSSDAQRADNFEVSCKKNGYVWKVSNPGAFSGNNKKYVFYSNLQSPYGEKIQTGEYLLTYYDAAGEKVETRFYVNYDEKLIDSKTEDVRGLVRGYTESLAVYDDYNELVFIGKPKSSWRDNENIIHDYKAAVKKRTCISTSSSSVVCLLPEEKLREEK